MVTIVSARGLAVLSLLGGTMTFAQSTLPAIKPTALAQAGTAVQPSAAEPGPGASNSTLNKAYPAEVTYVRGQLEIDADNSSLNQILREIGRVTGMTITGGVADQRVFGKYGPGAPADILASLLEGTGSNMLLRETAASAPAELILTPREGSATPPNPNASSFDDDSPTGEQNARRAVPQPAAREARVPFVQPPVALTGAPQAAQSSSSAQAQTASAPSATPSASAGNPQSPNGALTPQQIYRQLQQLQKTQPQK